MSRYEILSTDRKATVSDDKEYIIHKIKRTSSTLVKIDSQTSQNFKALHRVNNCE